MATNGLQRRRANKLARELDVSKVRRVRVGAGVQDGFQVVHLGEPPPSPPSSAEMSQREGHGQFSSAYSRGCNCVACNKF